MYAYFKKTAQTSGPAGTDLVQHRVHRARAARAARGGGRVGAAASSRSGPGRSGRSASAASFPTTSSIPEDQVRVIMPDTGSGYGGKHTGDAALEAARLAKAVGQAGEAQLDARGGDDVGVPASRRRDRRRREGRRRTGPSPSGSSTTTTRGTRGCNRRTRSRRRRSSTIRRRRPLRQGSYRGLAATANHFVRESYMDELAHAAKMDPLEFRLKNAKDERLRNVIVAAAEKFGWKDRKKAAGPRLRHRRPASRRAATWRRARRSRSPTAR